MSLVNHPASSIPRSLALVALGVGLGYLAAYFHLGDSSDPAASATQGAVADPTPADDDAGSADILVVVSAGNARQITTVLLDDPPIIVVPAVFAARADRLHLRTAAGKQGWAQTVVATSIETDLVALAAEIDAPAGLAVNREQGTLYVGREFTVLSAEGTRSGWVDSSARETRLGGYVYDGRTEAGSVGIGVLFDPDDGTMVGMAVSAVDDQGRFTAVDVATVADLLDARRTWQATDLDGFRAWYHRESPAGRASRLADLANEERWHEMVDMARLSMSLAGSYADEIVPLLELAYSEAARERSEDGQPGQAIDMLDDAEGLLGSTASRALLAATLHEQTGNPDAALDAYLAAASSDTDSRNARDRARAVIAKAAASGTVGDAELIQMIRRASGADASYAAYPMLAGEILLRQGQTPAAITQLRRALSLDPGLAPRIEPLLDTAAGRLANPSQIRVPVMTQGDVMIVDVRINGSGRPFRFVLDTGASYTAVSLRAALELGINAMFTGTPAVELETANGRVFADVVNLASVAVGDARAGNVDAVILETMRGVDGLLGQSFLGRFDVQIRAGEGELLLSPR